MIKLSFRKYRESVLFILSWCYGSLTDQSFKRKFSIMLVLQDKISSSSENFYLCAGIGWTSWKKRWFILTRTSLVFFRSDPVSWIFKSFEKLLTSQFQIFLGDYYEICQHRTIHISCFCWNCLEMHCEVQFFIACFKCSLYALYQSWH